MAHSHVFRDMLVIEHFGPSKNGGYPVALSIKPALLKASADMPTVLQPQLDTVRVYFTYVHIFSEVVRLQVQAGSLFVGYVASVKDFGVFVRFVGGFSALAPKNLLSDDPAGLAAYQPGQTVWAMVKSVDVSAKRLVLSLKPSHVKKLLPEPAKDPVEGPQKKSRRERSGSVSGLSAATLTVGTTVLCRAEASSLSVTDGVGIDPHCPLLKAGLAVQLTGVSGRYKARLTLAECCDVCPYTGSVINNEGFTTFQRLVASSSSAPVFRAKVVSIKAGKSKFGPDGEVLREGVADVELTVSVL